MKKYARAQYIPYFLPYSPLFSPIESVFSEYLERYKKSQECKNRGPGRSNPSLFYCFGNKKNMCLDM